MISYAMIGTNDVPRAEAFWLPLFEMLGGDEVVAWRSEDGFWFRRRDDGQTVLAVRRPFDGQPAGVGNGTMMGIKAASRDLIDAVHARALALGGSDEGPPGVRGDDPDGFYGAYFRDPDGNKICVYRYGPR